MSNIYIYICIYIHIYTYIYRYIRDTYVFIFCIILNFQSNYDAHLHLTSTHNSWNTNEKQLLERK